MQKLMRCLSILMVLSPNASFGEQYQATHLSCMDVVYLAAAKQYPILEDQAASTYLYYNSSPSQTPVSVTPYLIKIAVNLAIQECISGEFQNYESALMGFYGAAVQAESMP